MSFQADEPLIKKYKQILESNKSSKAFISLAEIYRKNTFLEKALNVCKLGLKENPNFANGYLVMAKVYYDLRFYDHAVSALNKVINLEPESLTAYKILAEIYLKEADMRKALKCFESVLFLNPHDPKARYQVLRIKKLLNENEDHFKMKKLEALKTYDVKPSDQNKSQTVKFNKAKPKTSFRSLERYLSLMDEFILRSNFKKLKETIKEAETELGKHPEFTKRLAILSNKFFEQPSNKIPDKVNVTAEKIKILENILDKVR